MAWQPFASSLCYSLGVGLVLTMHNVSLEFGKICTNSSEYGMKQQKRFPKNFLLKYRDMIYCSTRKHWTRSKKKLFGSVLQPCHFRYNNDKTKGFCTVMVEKGNNNIQQKASRLFPLLTMFLNGSFYNSNVNSPIESCLGSMLQRLFVPCYQVNCFIFL